MTTTGYLLASLPERISASPYIRTPRGSRVSINELLPLPTAYALAEWISYYQRAIREVQSAIAQLRATHRVIPQDAVTALANHRYNLGSTIVLLGQWCEGRGIQPSELRPIGGVRFDAEVDEDTGRVIRTFVRAQDWIDYGERMQRDAARYLPDLPSAPTAVSGMGAVPVAVLWIAVIVVASAAAAAVAYALAAQIERVHGALNPLAESARETARVLRETLAVELAQCSSITDPTARAQCQSRAVDTFLPQIDAQNRRLARRSVRGMIVVGGLVAGGLALATTMRKP